MDYAKGVLIILVVFGHCLEYVFGIEAGGVPEVLRSMIYCFHIPLFVFIAGYFSKNADRAAQKAVVSCLIPYLLFNYAWTALYQKTFFVDLFTPTYVFWFMLSLFFWRSLIGPLSKIRYLLIVSVCVGLYAGCIDNADRFMSVSRTLAFFPFFILGYLVDNNQITKLRTTPFWVGVFVFLLALGVAATTDYTGIIPVRAYENIQSYRASGMEPIFGIAVRVFEYVIACIAIFSLISFIPNRKGMLSLIGSRTLCVYLLSSFVIYGCFFVLKRLTDFSFIENNATLAIFTSLAITMLTIACTANKYVSNIFSKMLVVMGGLLTNS